MRVFISRTFREKEKKEVEEADYITQLAIEAGLEPVVVSPSGGKIVPDQIISEMKSCIAYVGIFTKRDKLASTGTWTIAPSILMEMAMARVLNLKIAGFIDEDISRDQLGIIGMEGWQIIDLNVKTMYRNAKREEIIKYFSGLKQEIPKPANPFRFLRFTKEVEIKPDGYGLVTHSCRLKVLSKDFKQFVHMFTLSENAGKNVKLPDFNTMRNKSPQAYWNSEPFFAFRLLDPISPQISSSLVTVVPTNNCNDETIEFAVKVEDGISDVIINYEWSIGCPDLFPTSKAALLTKGSRKSDKDQCFSYLRLGHGPIDEFTYRLIFHGNPEFDSPPALKIYDGADNLSSVGGSFDLEKRATRYCFQSNPMNTELLTTGRIVAEWIPK